MHPAETNMEEELLKARDICRRDGVAYLEMRRDGGVVSLDPERFKVVDLDALEGGYNINRQAARLDAEERKRGRPAKWPFASMEVGEYTLIRPGLAQQAQNYVHTYGRKVNKSFLTYTRSDGFLVVRRKK